MIVLDTDHITLLLRDTGPTGQRLKTRLRLAEKEGVTTTIVTFEEQSRGWLALLSNARSVEQMVVGYRHLCDHLEDYRSIRVLEFDRIAVSRFFDLKRARIRIGTMDLKIASIVLALEGTLLSRNLGDFRKIPDLKVEDWSA